MKLKVGDRVAVYGHDRMLNPIRIVSVITGIPQPGVIYLDEATSFVKGEYDLTLVHPKQCRKLKKPGAVILYISPENLQALRDPDAKFCGLISNYRPTGNYVPVSIRSKAK